MSIGLADALIITFASGLILIDWLMGHRRRKKLQNKVGDWWVIIEQRSFKPFGKKEAQGVLRWMEDATIYDRNEFGFYRSFAFNFFIALLILSVIIQVGFGGGMNAPRFNWPKHTETSRDVLTRIHLLIIPLTTLCTTLCFLVTVFFLTKTSATKNLLQFPIFVIIDVAIIIVVFFLNAKLNVIVLNGIISVDIPNLFIKNQYDAKIYESFIQSFQDLSNFKFNASFQTRAVFTLNSLALIPLLIYLILCFFYFLMWLFRPILKPTLSLVLGRFYESDKGVLTLIAIFLGGVVKIITAFVK